MTTTFLFFRKYKRYKNGAEQIIDFQLVGEPKWPIVQKRIFFAPERYTAEFLHIDSLTSN